MGARALWDEIRTLSREGTTIFLTTQYLEEAETLTDRVAVLDAARIVTQGSVAELKARHGRTVLEVTPLRLEDIGRILLATVPRAATSESAGTIRVELEPQHAAHDIAEMVARLRDGHVELASIAVHESSLEDIFVLLTGSAIEHEAEAA